MDAAVDAFARRAGVDVAADERVAPEIARFPFDPRRRRTSTASADRLYVKGAPDTVLPVCAEVPGAEAALGRLTDRGLRVIAVATRTLERLPAAAEDVERDLELVGFLGLLDPPRSEVAGSIAACRQAGIRIAMVTGDHPATAEAIARAVGLSVPGSPVLLGDELPDDEQDLGAVLDRDGIVLARVSPEQKPASREPSARAAMWSR